MPNRDPEIFRFSTSLVEERERFSLWADEFGAKIGHYDMDSPNRKSFSSDFTCLDFGTHAFLRMLGSPAYVARQSPSQLLRAGVFPLHLLLKLGRGSATLEQNGRIATIKANQLTIIDSEKPMRLSSSDETNSLLFGISTPLLERWAPHAQRAATMNFRQEGWASMLTAYLRGLDLEHVQRMTDPLERRHIEDHVMSMLAFMLAEQGLSNESTLVASKAGTPRDRMLYNRMCQWLRENYGDSTISAQVLAANFNVSVRYVHKVFAAAGNGTTFLTTLQGVRLEAAARQLRHGATLVNPIAEVAFRCGFSDPAYFGLVFRKRFGMSPGRYAKTHAMVEAPFRPAAEALVADES